MTNPIRPSSIGYEIPTNLNFKRNEDTERNKEPNTTQETSSKTKEDRAISSQNQTNPISKEPPTDEREFLIWQLMKEGGWSREVAEAALDNWY